MSNQTATSATTKETGLRKFLSAVEAAMQDAAALQVLTFTGNVKSYIKPVGDTGSGKKPSGVDLNWEDFFEAAVKDTTGELSLVAATQVMLDGDTILFVAENPPASLVEAHTEAVEAAQAYRQGLVSAVANIIGLSK